VLAPNDALRDASRTSWLGEGRLWHPEDVAFDAQGRMYAGSRDPSDSAAGLDVNPRIERISFNADGSHTVEEFVQLPGGGPLDMRFDAQGNLIVSSWRQGLIRVSPERQVTTLVAEGELIDGRPYGYSDGIAIASDGKMYHTQGTTAEVYALPSVLGFLSNAGPGRLIETDPATGESRTLIDNLSFGNGVVLAPDESYVLVADQLRYRILRYWLSGPQAGSQDVWMDNLPGAPHNLYRDEQNVIWVALNRGRVGLGDTIRSSAFLARQAAKVWPLLAGQDVDNLARDETQRGAGSVLALDFERNVLLSLQNPPMQMNTLSTAVYHNGAVYIGTIGGGPVLRYQLETRPTPVAGR
jgi:sugar lactone lactonase YvrE